MQVKTEHLMRKAIKEVKNSRLTYSLQNFFTNHSFEIALAI